MITLIDYTIATLRWEPAKNKMASLLFCTAVNSAIRLSAVYLLIRVCLTAVQHGSF